VESDVVAEGYLSKSFYVIDSALLATNRPVERGGVEMEEQKGRVTREGQGGRN
jgi:hypothetical protein